jgi:hypothetical protein
MSERSPDDAAVLNAWIAKGDCNPSVAKEWLEEKQIEFARTERLPASESLTVGEMIDLVTVLDRTPNLAAGYPALDLQLFRRSEVLRKSEGFQGFLAWKDIRFHRGTVIEAAKEFLALLVDRFQKPSDELRQMVLLDAVCLLTQPDKAPPPIDFDALVNALLERRKPTQAALVRFMADRETATAEEVGDKVHGNSEASDKAIRKNARETSDSLAGIGSRLSFRFVSGTMFRKIADE